MLFCNFSQNITKVILIWRLKVAKNSTVRTKCTGCLKVTDKIASNRNLQELFRMGPSNFVAISLLKILYSLVSMQNVLNANNCRHCLSFLVFLAVEDVVNFTKTCFYRKRGSVTMRKCVKTFHVNIGHNLD